MMTDKQLLQIENALLRMRLAKMELFLREHHHIRRARPALTGTRGDGIAPPPAPVLDPDQGERS